MDDRPNRRNNAAFAKFTGVRCEHNLSVSPCKLHPSSQSELDSVLNSGMKTNPSLD